MEQNSENDTPQSDEEFARRVEQWSRGEIEFSEEEENRALARHDPDLLLITRYIGGEFNSHQRRAVELRARVDPAFCKQLRLLLPLYPLQAERLYEEWLRDTSDQVDVDRINDA